MRAGSWNDETCGFARAFLCRVTIEASSLEENLREFLKLPMAIVGGLLVGSILLFVRAKRVLAKEKWHQSIL